MLFRDILLYKQYILYLKIYLKYGRDKNYATKSLPSLSKSNKNLIYLYVYIDKWQFLGMISAYDVMT